MERVVVVKAMRVVGDGLFDIVETLLCEFDGWDILLHLNIMTEDSGKQLVENEEYIKFLRDCLASKHSQASNN